MHAVAALALWYEPASHGEHSALPPDGATLPGAQLLHTDASSCPVSRLLVPGGHARHASAKLLPVSALYRPVGHAVQPPPHVSALAPPQKPPAAQRSHAVCPVSL